MNARSLTLSLLAGLALAGCSRERPIDTQAQTAVRVSALPVRVSEEPVAVELTATVRPVQRAQLAAKLMGSVREVPVALGQAVHEGEVLVRLQAQEIAERVAQARTAEAQARRELGRERALLAKGATTSDLVRNLEERLAGAEAQLREAEALLGYTEIRAPFDGVVARKLVLPGDLAVPGQQLLEVEGRGQFEIEVAVPESLAEALSKAKSLRVHSSAGAYLFDAGVRELSSAADLQARAVLAKLSVPEGGPVRSGQYVRVQVPGPSASVILVPATAVSRLGQMDRVFVIQDGRAVMRLVRTGAVRAGRLEISAGLSAGDRIVATPEATLRDGQAVEVQP